MNEPQSITSLPESPDDGRHRRMIQYGVAMGIRLVCVILCFFVQGWWIALPLAGALLLPYVAVVLANVGTSKTGTVVRPGALVRVSRPKRGEIDG